MQCALRLEVVVRPPRFQLAMPKCAVLWIWDRAVSILVAIQTHTQTRTHAHTHTHTHTATKMLTARFSGGNLTDILVSKVEEILVREDVARRGDNTIGP